MPYPSDTLYPGVAVFPGGEVNEGSGPELDAGALQWNLSAARQIETGLDRGVIYPKSGAAVPWNGLTGVDEEGGEGAVEFYMDGRPFLYFPTPKEFKATLRAYTYPDAFAAILGEVEVTDGMYLDSQQGDQFDLSYRTIVANSIQGIDYGYKIHLIYNAIAVPSAKSFGTITSEVTPTEFSWDIRAVPIPVNGYRPTAHITIDTRHMDVTRLAELEATLYGTTTTAAAMPGAQTIFDLLNFGDVIVITDNGDGTWDAEGSYHNVYLTGPDTFRIDNVDATDNGNDTYTISSTP